EIPSATSSATVLVDQDPGLTIGKIVSTTSADPNDAGQADHVGQVLNYTVTVSNTGNIDLTGVTVTDGFVTLTGGQSTLAVGESEVLTGRSEESRAEKEGGTALANTASVTDAQRDTGSSSVTTLVDQDPGLTIGKIVSTTSADPNDAGQADHVGQALNYTVTVSNTGNIDLTGVTVTDGFVTLTGGQSTLAVGASEVLTGSHVVTQADLDAGTELHTTESGTDGQHDSGPPPVTTWLDQI